MIPVNYTIMPGDRLNTHCIFDTSDITTGNAVTFGSDSSQEVGSVPCAVCYCPARCLRLRSSLRQQRLLLPSGPPLCSTFHSGLRFSSFLNPCVRSALQMCMDFVMYYPKIQSWPYCGYVSGSTVCWPCFVPSHSCVSPPSRAMSISCTC